MRLRGLYLKRPQPRLMPCLLTVRSGKLCKHLGSLRIWRAWPYRVHPQCEATVEALLACPRCLLDEWTRRFREQFWSRELLLSLDCREPSMTISIIARWDICCIECRNATIRRLALAQDTWFPDLGYVSSRFLLGRQRLSEAVFGGHKPKSRACRAAKSKRNSTWRGPRPPYCILLVVGFLVFSFFFRLCVCKEK